MANPPPSFTWGVLLYPAFEVLDAFGPLEALNQLSRMVGYTNQTMKVIADTLDPVSSTAEGFTFGQSVVPTHTFSNAGQVNILLVPGGILDTAQTQPAVNYIKTVYPSLKYIISVCTGAGLLARAGILDGRKATTNKQAWTDVAALGPKTYWVADARFVIDGNVWTTSGVSAGTDGMLGLLQQIYGSDVVDHIICGMEYYRNPGSSGDVFAQINGDVDIPPKQKT